MKGRVSVLGDHQFWFCGEKVKMCLPSLFFCPTCTLNMCLSAALHSLSASALGLLCLGWIIHLVIQPSISPPPPFHMQTCNLQSHVAPLANTVFIAAWVQLILTLHWGHFWAFLCPCSMTLAQVRSNLSPFLYSRHFSPLCHGAWHLKHHTNWQLLHWICKMERKAYALFYSNVRGEMWICGDVLISPCTCAQSGWSCAPSEWWRDYTEGRAWCWSPADSAPKSNDTLPRPPWTGWKSRPAPPGSHGTHRSDSWCEISQVSPSGQHIWGQEGQASITAQGKHLIFPVKHNISSYYCYIRRRDSHVHIYFQ